MTEAEKKEVALLMQLKKECEKQLELIRKRLLELLQT